MNGKLTPGRIAGFSRPVAIALNANYHRTAPHTKGQLVDFGIISDNRQASCISFVAIAASLDDESKEQKERDTEYIL